MKMTKFFSLMLVPTLFLFQTPAKAESLAKNAKPGEAVLADTASGLEKNNEDALNDFDLDAAELKDEDAKKAEEDVVAASPTSRIVEAIEKAKADLAAKTPAQSSEAARADLIKGEGPEKPAKSGKK